MDWIDLLIEDTYKDIDWSKRKQNPFSSSKKKVHKEKTNRSNYDYDCEHEDDSLCPDGDPWE